MDIFRFIDSADIRRYLVKIQYRFSTEEKNALDLVLQVCHTE